MPLMSLRRKRGQAMRGPVEAGVIQVFLKDEL